MLFRSWSVRLAAATLLMVVAERATYGAVADIASSQIPALDSPRPEVLKFQLGDFGVSEKNGAATYSFPLVVPQGRNAMEPKLALAYSSQAPLRGGLAAGWSLELPMIRLDTSGGATGEERYSVSFEGAVGQLLPVTDLPLVLGNPTFRTEIDTSFTRFERLGPPDTISRQAGWLARTTDGRTHYFGETPDSSDGVSRWYLSRQVDPYGNTVSYAWAPIAVGGRIIDFALRSIEYTSNQAAGLGAHAKVDFAYAPLEVCPGTDVPIGSQPDYRSGALYSEGALRLQRITTSVRDLPGGPWRTVRKVNLGYDLPGTLRDRAGNVSCTGESAPLRLLTRIDVEALSPSGDKSIVPPLSFTYGASDLRFGPAVGFANSGINSGHANTLNTTLLDFDGDGLLDELSVEDSKDYGLTKGPRRSWCDLLVRKGVGMGAFGPAQRTALPSAWSPAGMELTGKVHQSCSLNGHTVKLLDDAHVFGYCAGEDLVLDAYHLEDLDGDGRLDLLTAILYNASSGWSPEGDPDLQATNSNCTGMPRVNHCWYMSLGENPLDWGDVETCGTNQPSDCTTANMAQVRSCGGFVLRTYRNTGSDFERMPVYPTVIPGPLDDNQQFLPLGHGRGSITDARHAILDMTGDNRADLVIAGDYQSACGSGSHHWLVSPGNGRGGFGEKICWPVPAEAWSNPSTTYPAGDGESVSWSQLADINGDGLPDLLSLVGVRAGFTFINPEVKAFLNTGRGFTPGVPLMYAATEDDQFAVTAMTPDPTRRFTKRLVDVDGDGLLDRLDFVGGTPMARFNTGGTLLAPVALSAEFSVAGRETRIDGDQNHRWVVTEDYQDINGDGFADLASWTGSTLSLRTRVVGDCPPWRLCEVNNGRGLTVSFSYAATTDPMTVVQSEGSKLPHKLWVVNVMRSDLGSGAPASITTYAYANPVYAPKGRGRANSHRFLGFRESTTHLPMAAGGGSATVVRRFAYDDPADTEGRLVEEVTLGDDGRPLKHREVSWARLPLFDGRVFFTYAKQALTRTCAPGADLAACKTQTVNVHRQSDSWMPYLFNSQPVLYTHQQGQEGGGITVGALDRRTRRAHLIDGYGSPPGLAYRVLERLTSREAWSGSPIWRVLGRKSIEYDDIYRFPCSTCEWVEGSAWACTTRSFDPATGNILAVTKPEQLASRLATTYAYDGHQLFVAQTTNELGQVVKTTHDVGTGVQTERQGPNTRSSSWETERWRIDGFGRVTEHYVPVDTPAPTYGLALVEKTDYRDNLVPNSLLKSRLRDFGGSVWLATETFVDGLGRPISKVEHRPETNGPPAVTRYSYDPAGNLRTLDVPDPREDTGVTVEYRYTYDEIGRVTSLTRPERPNDTAIRVVHAGLCRRVEETNDDGSGSLADYCDDELGRLVYVQEVDRLGPQAVTRYTYDGADRLRGVVDAEGNETTLTYDGLGHRRTITRGNRTWKYNYDKNGNMTERTPPISAGQDPVIFTTRMTYDPLDRVLARKSPSRGLDAGRLADLRIGDTGFFYDEGINGKGRLARVELPFGSVNYSYDVRGEVIQEGRSVSTTYLVPVSVTQWVRRQHNALGLPTLSSWDDGTQWGISYDDRGLPQEVKWFDKKAKRWMQAANYVRSLAGQPRTRRTDYGQAHAFVYDILGRPQQETVSSDPNASRVHREYIYNQSSDLIQVLGSTKGASADASYSYDSFHRLVSAAGPQGYQTRLTYSLTGNVLTAQVTQPGSANSRNVRYEYGAVDPQAVDRLYNTGDGLLYAEMTYDLSGNVTRRASLHGAWDLEWDDQDRLIESRRSGASPGREAYYYDQNGSRILAVSELGEARFWFSESETHLGSKGTKSLRWIHLAAGGPTLARIENGLRIELQYSDTLQNLLLGMDQTATTTASFLYGAFGEVVADVGLDTHRRHFNGKEDDRMTGLRYYGFRYYDPLLLRWISADPKYRFLPDARPEEPQRRNLYAFSINNTLRYYDADGLEPDPVRVKVWGAEGSAQSSTEVRSRMVEGVIGQHPEQFTVERQFLRAHVEVNASRYLRIAGGAQLYHAQETANSTGDKVSLTALGLSGAIGTQGAKLGVDVASFEFKSARGFEVKVGLKAELGFKLGSDGWRVDLPIASIGVEGEAGSVKSYWEGVDREFTEALNARSPHVLVLDTDLENSARIEKTEIKPHEPPLYQRKPDNVP